MSDDDMPTFGTWYPSDDDVPPGFDQIANAAWELPAPLILPAYTNGNGHKHTDILSDALAASIPAPVFTPLTLAELLLLPPKQWLLDMIFGANDLVMMYGPPGVGKTFLAIDAIMCMALGRPWADRFQVSRPLTVAYCAGEGVGGLPQRFQAAAEFYGVKDLPNFTFFTATPQLHNKAATPETVHQFIADWTGRNGGPLDLLVIDTFHSATVGAEENSATDTGLVLSSIKLAQKVLGCAVMVLHHTNKNGTAERGSSALRGAMDCMIELSESGNKFEMTCEKLKDGAAWQPQTYSLVQKAESVRVWWDEPATASETRRKEEDYKERIVDLLAERGGQSLRASAIAEALGQNRSQIATLLSQMAQETPARISRTIANPDMPQSTNNPWIYSGL